MITRRSKPNSANIARKVERVMDNHFDHGDGAYQQRAAVVKRNLISLSKGPKVKIPVPKPKAAATKSAKPKPKQTKRPSEQKAEVEKKKAKPNKVKPAKRSPAAKKPATTAADATRRGTPRRGGGGRGPSTRTAGRGPRSQPIQVRWPNMSKSAQSSYIQSKAGKSVATVDADKAIAPIWNKLTNRQQLAHKKRHPQSRLKPQTRDSNPASSGQRNRGDAASRRQGDQAGRPPRRRDLVNDEEDTGTPEEVDGGDQDAGPEDHQDHEWWNDQTAEFQQDYLRRYPRSKFALRHRSVVRNLVGGAKDAIVRSAKRTGTDFHQGMQGIKAFRNGAKMTEEQADGLKRTAAKVGTVVVLAVIGLSVLSPLGPVAMDFGEAWFQSRFGQSAFEGGDNKAESGVNLEGHEKVDAKTRAEHKENNEHLAWMVKDMTKFMLSQRNPKKFAKKISSADPT